MELNSQGSDAPDPFCRSMRRQWHAMSSPAGPEKGRMKYRTQQRSSCGEQCCTASRHDSTLVVCLSRKIHSRPRSVCHFNRTFPFRRHVGPHSHRRSAVSPSDPVTLLTLAVQNITLIGRIAMKMKITKFLVFQKDIPTLIISRGVITGRGWSRRNVACYLSY